ncbi:lasso RiPP family leader peptide-containing protein [Streptomyces chrestomyceticus]|uniref:Lasso RiPP family leader peptide-containing protein n=1 Tax=Streptomyces chrestomyceticus TaxID=68185 RepID=A0ABU7WTK3_9ACTN
MQNNGEEIEYEAPELAEVGDFAELTLGFGGTYFDVFGGFLNL